MTAILNSGHHNMVHNELNDTQPLESHYIHKFVKASLKVIEIPSQHSGWTFREWPLAFRSYELALLAVPIITKLAIIHPPLPGRRL